MKPVKVVPPAHALPLKKLTSGLSLLAPGLTGTGSIGLLALGFRAKKQQSRESARRGDCCSASPIEIGARCDFQSAGTFSSSVRWPIIDLEMITPLVTPDGLASEESFGVGGLMRLGASWTVPSARTLALGRRSTRSS